MLQVSWNFLRWKRAHWCCFLIKDLKARSYGNYCVLSLVERATATAEGLVLLSIAIWTVLHVTAIFRSCELVITDYICQNTKIPKGYCDNCHFDVWLWQRSPHIVLHNKLTFSVACTERCNNGCPEQLIQSVLHDFYTHIQASQFSIDSLEHPLEGQIG